jgi:membrane fusion protein, heavy metal efflux system
VIQEDQMDPDEPAMVRGPEDNRRRVLYRVRQLVAALVLVALGVAGGVFWSERRTPPADRRSSDTTKSMPAMPGMPAPGDAATSSAAKSDEPVEVLLTPDAVARAGIKTETVQTAVGTEGVSVPGTVTSNAYRDTKVNALVGGVVRQVVVELGASVTRGDPLAVIFSSDLADAQMKYLSMRAMFEADHQKVVRTEKLVTIGAASRQELEEVTAIHAGHETELAAARQRLLLLGLSTTQVNALTEASQVVSEVTVPAPATGVIIARTVNPGQVVSASQDLFVVTDLSTVWVIGDLYEKDFPAVRVGSNAAIMVPATDQTLRGRVAYIDPRVDPASRTAKVRVEVPNTEGNLRLGMFVTMSFQTQSDQRMTVVPQAAVQAVGERTVVYTPAEGEDGKFVERPVKLGPTRGKVVQVLEGLKPGEKVVTDGSFFLRSEAARTRSGG